MTGFYTLILGLTLLHVGERSVQAQDLTKPDLVIQDVEYNVVQPTIVVNSGIVVSSTRRPLIGEFTVKIVNLGLGKFDGPFYLSWADNESDIRDGKYSHGKLLNQQRDVIQPGDSLVIHLRTSLYHSNTIIKFFIQHDGLPNFGISTPAGQLELR